MEMTNIPRVLAALILMSFAVAPGAQGFDFGKREYDANCAVCHGKKGKGDGPYAGIGETRVSDLTVLTKRNNGVFPTQRVYEIIDGRVPQKAHGPREMPIWGDRYMADAREAFWDVPYDPESFIRTRIVALTEYINRLQAK